MITNMPVIYINPSYATCNALKEHAEACGIGVQEYIEELLVSHVAGSSTRTTGANGAGLAIEVLVAEGGKAAAT